VGEGARCYKRNVVHVRIDPSVVVIPEIHFWFGKSHVEKVDLHDGVREISDYAFRKYYAFNYLM
jgi:hypothetical protein